jgi:ABC-type Na+ efflux pump permease subunit
VTVLALLLAVVALAQPVWTFQRTRNADVDRTTYSWTTVVDEEWSNGVWSSTTVTPYSSPDFDEFRMREAVTASYAIAAGYALLAALFTFVQYLAPRKRLPANLVSVFGFLVLFAGLAAIAYPAATIGAAASQDVNAVVTGFAGSADDGRDLFAWGAGAAWGLWAVSSLLMLVVVLAPLAQRRHVARPAPRGPYPNRPW